MKNKQTKEGSECNNVLSFILRKTTFKGVNVCVSSYNIVTEKVQKLTYLI